MGPAEDRTEEVDILTEDLENEDSETIDHEAIKELIASGEAEVGFTDEYEEKYGDLLEDEEVRRALTNLMLLLELDDIGDEDLDHIREWLFKAIDPQMVLEGLGDEKVVKCFKLLTGPEWQKPYYFLHNVDLSGFKPYLDFEMSLEDEKDKRVFELIRQQENEDDIESPLSQLTVNLLASRLKAKPEFSHTFFDAGNASRTSITEFLEKIKGKNEFIYDVLKDFIFGKNRGKMVKKIVNEKDDFEKSQLREACQKRDASFLTGLNERYERKLQEAKEEIRRQEEARRAFEIKKSLLQKTMMNRNPFGRK